jgi:hypothetical protein
MNCLLQYDQINDSCHNDKQLFFNIFVMWIILQISGVGSLSSTESLPLPFIQGVYKETAWFWRCLKK